MPDVAHSPRRPTSLPTYIYKAVGSGSGWEKKGENAKTVDSNRTLPSTDATQYETNSDANVLNKSVIHSSWERLCKLVKRAFKAWERIRLESRMYNHIISRIMTEACMVGSREPVGSEDDLTLLNADVKLLKAYSEGDGGVE